MTSTRVLIVGAGFAGIAAAHKLVEHGINVLMIEREPQAGGLSKTFTVDGELFDIGPHIYFNDGDSDVQSFWREMEFTFDSFTRESLLFANGKFYNSPVQIRNVIENLGLFRAFKLFFGSFGLRRKLAGNSSKDWIIQNYGRSMYDEFFASYNTKFWGYSPSQLSADWVHQRIKKSLFRILLDSKTFQKDRLIKRPRGGSSALVESCLKSFQNRENFSFQLNVSVERISRTDTGFSVLLSNGPIPIHASHVLFSGHLDELATVIDELISVDALNLLKDKAKSLVYRNLILVCIIFKSDDYLEPSADWIEVHDSQIKTIRVTNFSRLNLSSKVNNNHRICLQLEYNCFETEKIWNFNDENLLRIALDDLLSLNLIREGREITYKVFRVPRAYPIYTLDYRETSGWIKDTVNTINNLFLIGRNGNFLFDNVNQAVKTGLVAAEACLNASQDN